MRKAFVEHYCKTIESVFKTKCTLQTNFQIQIIEWHFFGDRGHDIKTFVVFPFAKGSRILVEITKNNGIVNHVFKLISEIFELINRGEFTKYQAVLNELINYVMQNKRNVFIEKIENDVLKRERVKL